jgi:hypothetical protein
MLDIDGFRFGIEHEFAVIDDANRFCDFANTTFEELDRVVERMPVFETDYPSLRVGDLGIKKKRWYIEGFERFAEDGRYLRTDPKGFEIRTPICDSLDEAIETLTADFERWRAVASGFGYRSARTSLNPFRSEYVPQPELNEWEVAQRRTPEEQTAYIHMLTYGPDISFSHPDLAIERVIDIGRKLTFYSPFVVVFTFSSPFYEGKLWGGYSRRTYYRTGPRPSVLVHVGREEEVVPSFPTLTDRARLPAEVGRIEFKAFDCVADIASYRALGTLLLGLALDETLSGRALVPDEALHKRSATAGFDDETVGYWAGTVLRAAQEALPRELRSSLDPLQAMLEARRTPAHAMIETFRECGDMVRALESPAE